LKRLRLGFYPYAYARVTVMKGDLIKKDDWKNYMKMGPNELLRAVSGTYKEIEKVDAADTTSLEIALNRSMMNTFAKLNRISDEKLQKVIQLYAQRYDVENIKTIIRGKISQISNEEITQLMLPSLNYDTSFFSDLIKKETAHAVIAALPFDIDVPKSSDDEMFVIDNLLDRHYMELLAGLSTALRGQGKAFRSFIDAERNILNVKTIMRLIQEKTKQEDIQHYIILPSPDITELAKSATIKELAAALHKKGLIENMPHAATESELCTELEIALDTTLLKKESLLMHQHPLTVSVMLGFMLLKEIEVRNLKVVLKGKLLGLNTQQIERLVVAA